MVDVDVRPAVRKETSIPRLSSGEYLRVFLADRRVQFYVGLATAATIAALWFFGVGWQTLFGVVAVLIFYPFVEYVIHRWVFHNRFLFQYPLTARFWRLLHYHHHLDPNDADIIFGPPHYMLLIMMVACIPLGWLVGGPAGSAAAAVTGLWILPLYEYFHAGAHMVPEPRTAYGRMLRKMHMFHHYHSERGNYGVTSPIADMVFGTYYTDGSHFGRSATVRNLGYDEEAARRYPWLAENTKD